MDPGPAKTEFSIVPFKGDAERAGKVHADAVSFVAEDIAKILVWVAGRPPHVNIDELVVKRADQPAVGKVFRRGRVK